MSTTPHERILRHRARNEALFEQTLCAALNVARSGDTALVVLPAAYPIQHALNLMARMLDNEKDWHAKVTSHELHFTGTRGSVRLFHADHIEYDASQKRMRGYPVSVPTFLHPEVQGL